MAAYQCLNCEQIERSSLEDCCDNPDLFCINDMPGEIRRLRKAVAAERERCANKAAPEHIPFSDEEWRIRCDVRDAILEATK